MPSPKFNGAGDRNNLIVPTDALAEWIEPRLVALEEAYEGKHSLNHNQPAGAFASFFQDASYLAGIDYNSIPRRIWSIRRKVSLITNFGIADAYVLALGESIGNTDIPVFPGGPGTACEMVEVHFDLKKINITEKEKRRLAQSLYSFSKAYIEHSADEPTQHRIDQGEADRRHKRDRKLAKELITA